MQQQMARMMQQQQQQAPLIVIIKSFKAVNPHEFKVSADPIVKKHGLRKLKRRLH